jgi:hypothetical protein
MLSEQEKSWLAAMIESEGCLSLSYERRKPKGRDYEAVFTVMTIHISNCNPYLIKRISELWKRLDMKFHFIWTGPSIPGRAEALYITCNSVGSSKKLLEDIIPYLVTKTVEANILLEYANYREHLIKNRGPDGRWKDYIDRKYVDSLITSLKKAKWQRYDMSRLPRKAGEVLDLSNLRPSETTRETPNGEDIVRTSAVMPRD